MTDRPTTRHGVKRSRQRLGVPARAVAGLARRAFERGTPAEQLEGRVGAWARGRVHLNAGRTSSRLHGEHLFIFGDDDALVTVLCVPPTLLVELRAARRRGRA